MVEGSNGVSYDPTLVRRAGPDPMDRVLGLDGRSSNAALVAGAVGALIFHFAVAAQALTMSIELREWTFNVRARVAQRLQDLYEVDLSKPPEPPPPPPPEPPPEVKAPAPPPVAKAAEPPPPPPPAAAAGKIVAADPDPNDPVDMTGAFIQGNSDTYTGGQTLSTGTGKVAHNDRNATPDGTGKPNAVAPAVAPAEDKSKVAELLGSTDWNCSSYWPAEADADQIDNALVTIQVTVGPDGKPIKVDVVKDPGHGFGVAARRCAMRESFKAGTDKMGTAIVTQTKPFRVRFER